MALTERSHLLGNSNLRISTIKQLLHRIRWPHVLSAAAIIGLLGFVAFAAMNEISADSETNILQSNLKLTLPDSSGTENELKGVTFSAVSGPKASTLSSPLKLTVRTDILDGAQLTSMLSSSENYTQNLVSIDIEIGTVIGNFSRVYLPNLLEYRVNVTEGVADIPWFDRVPEKLQRMIFFDLSKPTDSSLTSWDLIKDVANLPVTLSVSIKATKLIEINRAKGLIELNVDFSWKILENIKGTYLKLVLVSCPLAQAPSDSNSVSFPTALKYLNLFNISNTNNSGPVQLSSFVKSQNMQSLDTLIVYEAPIGSENLQTSMNLPDLPKSLKRIAFRGVQLTNSGSSAALESLTAVSDLTFDHCEFEDGILENLQEIFPNVRILNLLNMHGDTNKLLAKAVSLTKVQRIFVMGWNRTTETLTNDVDLNSYGVSATLENFMLSRQYKNGKFNISANVYVPGPNFLAEEITLDDSHRKRYDALGFPDFEEYKNYFNSLTIPYID